MAESGTGPTPSLAEQWSLPPSEEQPAKEVVVEKPSETAAAEKTDEAPVANQADETPGTEKTDETLVVAKAEEAPPVENTEESSEKTDENPSSEEGAETPVEEQPEEEEATEEKSTIKIETAPADFRFPTTNQTRHCFTRYIEYHRCIQAKGEDAQECEKFAKYYRSLCPTEWIERWNEQRENGTFPGPL